FGAVLENVAIDEDERTVDFHDARYTENTRAAYPIEHVPNARIPCMAGHPSDIIFLTCDAFGVLPPCSRLGPAHAMYHFISGYTVVPACPVVPPAARLPRKAWTDPAAYDVAARKLAGLLRENFKSYEGGVDTEVKEAGPRVA